MKPSKLSDNGLDHYNTKTNFYIQIGEIDPSSNTIKWYAEHWLEDCKLITDARKIQKENVEIMKKPGYSSRFYGTNKKYKVRLIKKQEYMVKTEKIISEI
jgi:hypothetical protein